MTKYFPFFKVVSKTNYGHFDKTAIPVLLKLFY